MSDQQQQVDAQAAREAAMSRVVTAETILKQISNADPATQGDQKEDQKDAESGDKSTGKKTAQERIQELVNKRREADAKADAKERENAELKEALKRYQAAPPPIEQTNKPKRGDFASDDVYQDAVIDWRADQRLAEREKQQREARIAEEFQQIESDYVASVKTAKAKYEDFEEVISAATVNVPDFIVMAIKENKYGGDITYYLSKNIDEAKKIFAMRPVKALEQIIDLGKELGHEDDPVKTVEKVAKKTKVPEPITPLQGQAAINPGGAKSYEEYKAKRLAEKRK